MHQPTAAALRPVRERIIDHPDEVDQVLSALAAADVEVDRESQVKTMPRGFAEHSDHPYADLVRCTQLIAMRPLPKTCWLDDTVANRAVEAAHALRHLYDFIDRADA